MIAQIISVSFAHVFIKKASLYSYKELLFLLNFGIAGILYVLSVVTYIFALRSYALSKIGPLLSLATICLVFIFGIIFFKEMIKLSQIIGLVFGVAAIILMVI
jgi:uncharacterized membrane protein